MGSELAYMAAAMMFVLGIKRLSRVKTAAAGNRLAAKGMLLAIATTLVVLYGSVGIWIVLGGVLLGSAIGFTLAQRVPMTAMPELVALFNGLGGAASLLVALAEIDQRRTIFDQVSGDLDIIANYGAAVGVDSAAAVAISILIGSVTVAGSLVAYAKLAPASSTGPRSGRSDPSSSTLCWYWSRSPWRGRPCSAHTTPRPCCNSPWP